MTEPRTPPFYPTLVAGAPSEPAGPQPGAPASRRALLAQLARAAAVAGAGAVLPAWAQTAAAPAAGEPTALERVKQRGRLVVAVYKDMPPFVDAATKGIDVEIARALARSLGVELSLLPFLAAEDMNDDLRNMVWRGHYLGHGPADVLVHVPVDRPLMQNNPRVTIFAPYYRERIHIARRLAEVPQMPSLEAFAGKRIAVPGQSLAGWLMIGADEGRYRDQLITRWKDGTEAALALQRGDVAAAAATASELEAVLAGDPAFAIEPLPLPRARGGWAVGLAVKRESTDLAQALQAAVNQLAETGELGRIFAASKVAWARP